MSTVSQPLIAVGRTHASSVMPVERSSGLLVVSVTVTQSFTPSNDRALPNLPGTCTAWRIVPALATGDESSAVVLLVSSNANAATRPDVPSETDRVTAVPAGRAEPPAGFWLMIDPAGTAALFANVTAPSVKPDARMLALPSACASPTTAGTMPGAAGPSDTIRFTAPPGAMVPPGSGLCVTMVFAAKSGSFTNVMAPTTSASPARSIAAAATVRSCTSGMSGPSDMTSVTALPGGTPMPASGFVPIATPFAIVRLFWVETTLTESPAALMAAIAAACDSPATFGMAVPTTTPPGAATFASVNCSRSTFRTRSVPSTPVLSVTLSEPSAFTTML